MSADADRRIAAELTQLAQDLIHDPLWLANNIECRIRSANS